MSEQEELLDIRMADGSRHFAEVPAADARTLRRRLLDTPGVVVTEFIDTITETWIDFEYAGHSFWIHSPFNDYWLFVRDPSCPETLLRHVKSLLS